MNQATNRANVACTAYDVLSTTLYAMMSDAKLIDICCAFFKGLTTGLLINCLLASTSSFTLKAIVAIKGIKDQHELILEAIEEGNPWLVALRIMQMMTLFYGLAAQCFTGDTLVETSEGLVAIEDIEVGDYVLAEDTVTGEQCYKEVLKVHVTQTTKLVHVTTTDDDSDTTINTTDNHPFYVEGKGWVPAIELEAGDILRTADGSVEVVKEVSIEYLDEAVLIYNLEIEGYHTYHVSDESVLVHNTNNCGPNNKDDGSGGESGSSLDDDAIVVRGGVSSPENLMSNQANDPRGHISANSGNGVDLETLATTPTSFKNGQLSIATVGDIRGIGMDVIPDPTVNNPYHVSIIPKNVPMILEEANELSDLFIKQPNEWKP